jgi:hypothetical protein
MSSSKSIDTFIQAAKNSIDAFKSAQANNGVNQVISGVK